MSRWWGGGGEKERGEELMMVSVQSSAQWLCACIHKKVSCACRKSIEK